MGLIIQAKELCDVFLWMADTQSGFENEQVRTECDHAHSLRFSESDRTAALTGDYFCWDPEARSEAVRVLTGRTVTIQVLNSAITASPDVKGGFERDTIHLPA